MTDAELIQIVQNHTNMPWFNGSAYAEYAGYHQQAHHMRNAVDDLQDVIAWAKECRNYEMADRLRTISDGLNKHIALVTQRR